MINSLNVAQTGLKAARVSVENVMNNIANANTEGYKKRVVETSELAHSDDRIYGRGISIDDTVRISSQYLYDNIIKENSKEMNYTELSSILENVESIFKETEGSGLSADLDRYYQTVENLRSNPNSEIYKSELKQNAQLLVDDIKRLLSASTKLANLKTLYIIDNSPTEKIKKMKRFFDSLSYLQQLKFASLYLYWPDLRPVVMFPNGDDRDDRVPEIFAQNESQGKVMRYSHQPH